MNQQDIFDRVLAHLSQQKCRASTHQGCMYRTPDGLKCAVGALIPDDLYDPRMDTGSQFSGDVNGLAHGIRERVFSPQLGWITENRELLISLQKAHDAVGNWKYRDSFESDLWQIAGRFELDGSNITPTLDAIFAE